MTAKKTSPTNFVGASLKGQRFGSLIAIRRAPTVEGQEKKWVCICSCGNKRSIGVLHLLAKSVISCDSCARKKKAKDERERVIHLTATVQSIQERTCDVTSREYLKAGLIGIDLYPKWIDNLSDFISYVDEELGPRPSNHILSRIKNTKGYFPKNLAWKAPTVLARSYYAVNPTLLDYFGELLPLPYICEVNRYDGPLHEVIDRILDGYTIEEALMTKKQGQQIYRERKIKKKFGSVVTGLIPIRASV